jgi:hypothetical protein
MKWHTSLLIALIAVLYPQSVLAQAPPSAHAAAHASSTAQGPAPSTLLQPALTAVQQTLSGLNFEKWHRGTIREEATSNAGSILKDIQENMPPLLKQVDGSPSSISVAIPLSAHVNALYDVLLRVAEASRVSGPGDQAASLQQALVELGKARRTFEDRMQQTAMAQEKEMVALHSSLNLQAAARPQSIPVPMVLPCGAFPTHRVVRKKSVTAPGQANPAVPAQGKPVPAAPSQTQKK